jgi:hypothetical protein
MMTAYLNIDSNYFQQTFSLQDILTIAAFLGTGISAIWIWFTNRDKQRLALEAERAKAEIEKSKAQHALDLEIAKQRIQAELEDSRDNREFKQEQNRLEIAYQQSEVSIAHRLAAEQLDKLIEFTIKDISEALDLVKTDTSRLPDISKRLGVVEEQARNLVSYYKILTGLLDDFHQKYERDRRNDS